MLEADDKMHRVIEHFVGPFFRLEIERAEIAVGASGGVKFWVQIKDALALHIDYTEVGITGTLHFAFGRERKIAAQIRSSVEQFPQSILKMATYFVDAVDTLNGAARCIQSLHCFIARCADRLRDVLIDWIARVESEYFFPSGIKNDFAEWHAPQLSIFIQQPQDELVYRRFGRWR